MTPKASADQGGGVEAAAREIVDHCPRCSRLLSRPDSDKRDVYECPGCGRWWQIAALTTQEAIAAALRAAPPDVEQIARGIHERMCTGSPACSWEDISEPGHRATHMETARIALDAVRAAPPSGPHNEVACVSCKQPVGVTALNAIRCGACGGSRAAAADVAVSALHDIVWRQPASTDRDDMNKLIWKIHGLLRDAAPPSGLTPPRPQGAAPAEYSAEAISRLASIRERLAKATPGPWGLANSRWVLEPDVADDGGYPIVAAVEHRHPNRDANANFIAAAPGDMAWLLARLDAQRESTASAAPEDPRAHAAPPREASGGAMHER